MNLVVKLLKNPQVRKVALNLLKNPRIRRAVIKQITRRLGRR